jgi:AcrR family transcriptional regulator
VIDEQHLFEVAASLFVQHGYAGTTTKEIAEATGVNEATLFRRYGSKLQLLEKAINHQWRDVPLAHVTYTGDVNRDLAAIVEAYVETNRLRGPILQALLAELARSPDLRGAFGAAARNIATVASIVERHQAEGRLRSEDSMHTVNALIGPLMVSEMFRGAGLETTTPIDADEHVSRFLEGRVGTSSVRG